MHPSWLAWPSQASTAANDTYNDTYNAQLRCSAAAGVPRTGGAHQQAALGDLGAQGGVLVGVLQKVNHLHQLQLGAVAALWGKPAQGARSDAVEELPWRM